MALQHIRSSTLDKRPQPASLSDGQLAINTNLNAPGVFFKDSNGALVKVGPTFVGTTAPNSTPGSGGATGNTLGEQWLDTSGGTYVLKIWDGTAWRSEAGEFVNVTGDTMTGALVMDNQQQVRFRETTANGTNYIALQAPASVASDKTITLPDVTGTVVTTGDTGSVTSTMIADGTIVDADISASAEIAVSKLADGTARQLLQTDSAGTGVEWASNIDIPGTLDVTSAATFDSTIGASAGAVGTPSITFTGDLNTGLWSPAADTIAASTGGSERLRIDSSGRLGIGTTSPKSILTANGNIVGLSTGTHSWQHYQQASSSYTVTSIDSVIDGATGNLVFKTSANWTNSDAAEKARIDSSGRLLVGTSTARTTVITDRAPRIQLEGTSFADNMLSITANANNGGDEATLALGKSRGTTVGSSTVVQSGDILGVVYFQGADGSKLVPSALIKGEVDGTPGTNDMPGRLVFSTTADGASSPTERMRIDSSGRVLISTTSSFDNTAYVQSTSTSGVATAFAAKITNSSTASVFSCNNSSNSYVGGINVSSTATAFATSSDYRLKENVTAVTDGITRLQELKPSRFNFIADPDTTVDGFLAHEVQTVVPEAIFGEKDAVNENGDPIYQSIDQAKLVPLLTAALQEALAEIESLKARVTALEP